MFKFFFHEEYFLQIKWDLVNSRSNKKESSICQQNICSQMPKKYLVKKSFRGYSKQTLCSKNKTLETIPFQERSF